MGAVLSRIQLIQEYPAASLGALAFLVAAGACMYAVPSHRIKLLLVFALGLFLRLFVALHDPLSLQAWPLNDDSHYYFNIAWNFAHGHGVRHDSFNGTTGFQPLFLLLMAPIYWLVGDKLDSINAVLVMQSGIGVLLGAAMYRFARLLGGASAGLFTAAVWAVSPVLLTADLSGLETNLALLMMVVTLTYYMKRFVPGTETSASIHAVLGFLCGLCFLARIDSGLLAPVLLADIVRREIRSRSAAVLLRNAAIMTVAAMVPVLPWAVYNLFVVGSILPSSGQAVRFISQAYGFHFVGGEAAEAGNFEIDAPPLAYYTATMWKAVGAIRGILSQVFPLWAGLLLIGAGCVYGFRRMGESLGRAAFVLPYLIGLFFAYTCYIFGQWFFDRYFVPIAIGYLMLLIFAIPEATRGLARQHRPWPVRIATNALVPLALSLLLFNSLQSIERIHSNPEPSKYYRVAEWVNANTPEEAVIGAFQSGILGYYLEREFYGLDGKINQDALEAMKDGTIDRYVRAKEIDYLMDWPWILDDLFVGRSSDPEFLSDKELVWEGPYSVYRLR